MASWNAKHRDPLFDQTTKAALERRGKELLGFALIGVGVLIGMMLVSYSPDDPSFLAATDEPAVNWLGTFGAYLAAPLFLVAGYGAWTLAVLAVVWGLRFVFHRGEERCIRAIFAPVWLVIVSAYAASHIPPLGWNENFGMGGHFGDMIMGGFLTVLPFKAAVGIKILALIFALAVLAVGAFVCGFDRAELAAIRAYLADGLSRAMVFAKHSLARAVLAVMKAVDGVKARRAAARDEVEAAFAEPPLPDQRPLVVARRAEASLFPDLPPDAEPEAELIENDYEFDAEAPPADRVSARISDAIRDHAAKEASMGQNAGAAPGFIGGRSVLAAVTARLKGQKEAGDLAGPSEPVPHVGDIVPLGSDRERTLVPATPRVAPSRQARVEAEPELRFDPAAPRYEPPPLALLASPSTVVRHQLSEEALMENARMLEAVLDDYGVKGQITQVKPGPVVTLYELEPAPGLKASRVIGLADDIARSMSALSARVSTVPGRSVIGIELPNTTREKVLLREILAARAFGDGKQELPLALGKDIGGDPVVANLAKMPHLLIAGTTGSGKSVAINTMILSLLYKLTPDQCRLIMVDPKMLELSVYDGIPHLLSPVVVDPKKAVVALKWVVGEMEERYRKMSRMGVRNIGGYNDRVRDALSKGEMFKRTFQTGFDEETGDPVFETEEFVPETLPYIVVVVDEMADLMMVAGKEIEACIQRLAQMARASGIHLIMATQRPSVDVITGTIKANFPTRISFQVTSKIDSRTILGEQGAEQLLGQGDMLYMAGGSKITRVHGPFVSDEEVEEVVNHLKSFGPPRYMSGVVEGPDEDKAEGIDAVLGLSSGDGDDALYDQAVAIVAKDRKCSTSYIQRKLAIGYNKAARLVEQMEEQGIVSPANHVGKREVLIPEV